MYSSVHAVISIRNESGFVSEEYRRHNLQSDVELPGISGPGLLAENNVRESS